MSILTQEADWHLALGRRLEDDDECPEQLCPCFEEGRACILEGSKRHSRGQECGARACTVRIMVWTSQWRLEGTKAYEDARNGKMSMKSRGQYLYEEQLAARAYLKAMEDAKYKETDETAKARREYERARSAVENAEAE